MPYSLDTALINQVIEEVSVYRVAGGGTEYISALDSAYVEARYADLARFRSRDTYQMNAFTEALKDTRVVAYCDERLDARWVIVASDGNGQAILKIVLPEDGACVSVNDRRVVVRGALWSYLKRSFGFLNY